MHDTHPPYLTTLTNAAEQFDTARPVELKCLQREHGLSQFPLRLRGGGQEMFLASAMGRSTSGVITADEALTLSRMGFLKGSWQAESEIEPESDVQVIFL